MRTSPDIIFSSRSSTEARTQPTQALFVFLVKRFVHGRRGATPLQGGVSQNLSSVTNDSFRHKLLKSLLLIGYQQICHCFFCHLSLKKGFVKRVPVDAHLWKLGTLDYFFKTLFFELNSHKLCLVCVCVHHVCVLNYVIIFLYPKQVHPFIMVQGLTYTVRISYRYLWMIYYIYDILI